MPWFHRLLRKRRAGVIAIMAAVMAPVLIGFAALAVDGGYWMGTQVALQAQANAGAIGAVRAQTYGLTTASAIQAVAQSAAAAASSAVASPSVTATIGTGTAQVTSQKGASIYLAQIMGVSGFQNAASASAGGAGIQQFMSGCLIAFDKTAAQSIFVSGGATITAQNCGVISDSSATSTTGTSNAIVAQPSGKIIAPQVLAVGGIYANTSGGAYIGAGSGKTGTVASGAALTGDPLAAMGTPPALPTFPANGATTNISSTGYSFSYSAAYSQSWGGCGSYSGVCYINAGSFDGFSTNTASFTFNTGANTPNGSSVYTVYGQIAVGGGGTVTLQTGTYYLSGDVKNGVVSDYAFTANAATVNFAGGTYYFNGGLNIAANDSVTFGPGIYIIANGNLNVGGGASITANDATFVLIDGAGFNFSGGSSGVSLSAPTSNCVQSSSYPLAAYSTSPPYDGTNGQGICSILIYQARNDAAVDSLSGSATIGVNGIIYAPATNLSLTGNTSVSTTTPANFNFQLGILANKISVTGSSSMNLQASPGSPLNDVTYTISAPILTQ